MLDENSRGCFGCPSTEIFFNLLRFLKKIPKHHLKYVVPSKKKFKTPLKKFLPTPLESSKGPTLYNKMN